MLHKILYYTIKNCITSLICNAFIHTCYITALFLFLSFDDGRPFCPSIICSALGLLCHSSFICHHIRNKYILRLDTVNPSVITAIDACTSSGQYAAMLHWRMSVHQQLLRTHVTTETWSVNPSTKSQYNPCYTHWSSWSKLLRHPITAGLLTVMGLLT